MSRSGRSIEIPHRLLLASAGSGKTYRLTNRFIQILARDPDPAPERIVALTFTRKAAGEFLDSILRKLAGASLDADRAGELGEKIGAKDFDRAEALELLRLLAGRLDRLGLGTLDSFFARLVGAFPFELGLAGGFRIVDGHELSIAKGKALGAVFDGDPGSRSSEAFLQAFKLATFGNEGGPVGGAA